MVAARTSFLSFHEGVLLMLRRIVELHRYEKHRKISSVVRVLNAVQHEEYSY